MMRGAVALERLMNLYAGRVCSRSNSIRVFTGAELALISSHDELLFSW